MTIYSVFQLLENYRYTSIVAIIVSLSLVEVSKIKINPWSSLGRWIYKTVFGFLEKKIVERMDALEKKIDSLNQKIDSVDSSMRQEAAEDVRSNILAFGDELIFEPERRHSKERFDNVIESIDKYEAYCSEHPNFPNGKTVATVQLIRDIYQKCLKNHSFL